MQMEIRLGVGRAEGTQNPQARAIEANAIMISCSQVDNFCHPGWSFELASPTENYTMLNIQQSSAVSLRSSLQGRIAFQ
jgi:hypothetical protein